MLANTTFFRTGWAGIKRQASPFYVWCIYQCCAVSFEVFFRTITPNRGASACVGRNWLSPEIPVWSLYDLGRGYVFCPVYHTRTVLSLKTVRLWFLRGWLSKTKSISVWDLTGFCRQIVPITSTREQIRRQLKGAAAISLSYSCHCHIHSVLGSLKRCFVISIFL